MRVPTATVTDCLSIVLGTVPGPEPSKRRGKPLCAGWLGWQHDPFDTVPLAQTNPSWEAARLISSGRYLNTKLTKGPAVTVATHT